ncbi:hypothetical protein NOV72_05739 [Caballeronia novacaledonica]|uniref:Uncharacterized protein n=1 Tax=Caballeronia novacaledonica TaxID=1544861 RepID=A0A2U3IE86_9BURK|nr:hypothetical protein [Caballeronia novacaledonica]SPB18539.1 hypothetical protein NOV72_05739 [Caballeronia novacaledonica]
MKHIEHSTANELVSVRRLAGRPPEAGVDSWANVPLAEAEVMSKPAEQSGKAPKRKTGKPAEHSRAVIVPVIHVLTAEEMRALLAQHARLSEPDPRARGLVRDASGMRPGDVLIEHMQGLEKSE